VSEASSAKVPPAKLPSVMDPQSLALGGVYAQALLDVVDEPAQAVEIASQLEQIVGVLEGAAGSDDLLAYVTLSGQHQEQMVERIFGGRCDPRLEAFLWVLARNGRLELLRAVSRRFGQLLRIRQGKVEVTVTTAIEMAPSFREQLMAELKDLAGGTPDLTLQVKESLLGGMVVTVGDRLYDASVAAELKRMRKKLEETMHARLTAGAPA
jgi:ATP synthase F1 delta subunit